MIRIESHEVFNTAHMKTHGFLGAPLAGESQSAQSTGESCGWEGDGGEGPSGCLRVIKGMKYWVVLLDIFYVHYCLGKIPILTNIFQMG